MNSAGRIAIFLASFYVGPKIIHYFGDIYASNAVGYRVGNRNRAVSIVVLMWVMVHVSLLMYLHLFSFFQAPFTVYKFGGRTEGKIGNGNARRLRSHSLGLFWIVLFFAHLAYLLYLVDSFEVSSYLYYTSCFVNGIWLHLAAFSCGFSLLNLLMWMLNTIHWTKEFLEKYLLRIKCLKLLATDHQFQVLTTLFCTFFLCFTHWYGADNLVVRRVDIPMPNLLSPVTKTENGSEKKELQVAVITDLHAGAIVYREQIAKVVDKVNSLQVDAVLIVGDAIDAPRHLIEDRIEPLRHLKSFYGTYYVTGNHEYYYGDVKQWILLFESYDIKVLQNSKVDLQGLCLIGLNDISSKSSGIKSHSMNVSALENCPREGPTLVMIHNPAAADDVVEYAQKTNYSVDLIVSGHTHAGQYYVVVPYVYWILPYFHGFYTINNGETKLLVSAGTLYQGAPMKMPFMSEIFVLSLTPPLGET